MQTTRSGSMVALLTAVTATMGCIDSDTNSIDPDGKGYFATSENEKRRHDLAAAEDLASPRDVAPTSDLTPINPCLVGMFCTSTLADQTLDLLESATVTFTILSSSAYSGTVHLTVQRAAIDARSGGMAPDVNISLAPAVVSLGGGVPAPVTLSLSTTTAAAGFTAVPFTLHLEDIKDPGKTFEVQVKLTVSPTLTITLGGDGAAIKHTWSTDSGTGINFQVRQRPVVAFSGGTTFIFLNNDINSHVIHGFGKIPHQGSSGTPPHGTYTVLNVNDTATMQLNGFYCHTHGLLGSAPAGERVVSFIP